MSLYDRYMIFNLVQNAKNTELWVTMYNNILCQLMWHVQNVQMYSYGWHMYPECMNSVDTL